MREVVARVARAIAKDRGENWDQIRGGWRDGYMSNARAAIEAMREPTEAMCEAGQEVNNLSEQVGHFEFLSRDEMTGAYQAMIDEALK